MRTRGLIAAALAATTLPVALPAAAQARFGDAVTMFSDSGDYIGQGQQRLFTPQDGSIKVGGDRRYLTIDVSGGTLGDSYTLDFAPPPGRRLKRAVYDYAQRAPFRTAGRPGIDISGSGRGCNEDVGRFQVRDIRTTRRGAIRRLWIVYEQHCEGAVPALFGEVRIGERRPRGAAIALPRIVRWPEGERGQPGQAVPVTLLARRTVHVHRVRVVGHGRRAFRIRLNGCSHHTLHAGSSCQVWVRLRERGHGVRRARLKLAAGRHRAFSAALQGFRWGGRTRVVMHSDRGDYIGAGRSWRYSARNAVIGAAGSRQHVGFSIQGRGGDWWFADFSPGRGDILARGTYRHARRDAFRGTAPGLDVEGNGRGCNTISGRFTVKDARFDRFGALHNFGAAFVQHCDGKKPALRGEFDFRAGDHTKRAPWMGKIGRR